MGDRVQADIKTAIERAIDFNHHAAQWDADDWAPIEAAISKGIADVRAATVAEWIAAVEAFNAAVAAAEQEVERD